ncbi:MAG TPA: hypothetical protein VF624_03700 [Tepidisphaeraceae bacterium]|jgi:hypothetical protein
MTNEHDDDVTVPPRAFEDMTDRTPHAIEQQILALSHKSDADTLAAALDASDWLCGRAKGISELAKRIAITWIEHNGDLTVGDIRYSVGYPVTVKCSDPRGCGRELLRTLGGDFDEFLSVLVAQPYKHGSAAKVLDTSVYRSFFDTKSAARLINGVPERTLKRVDTRFVPTSTRR